MAKFANYVLLMSGGVLIFYIFGFVDQSVNSTLLNLLTNPESLRDTPLALTAVFVLETIVASAVVVGFAIAGELELGIMSAFAVYLFNLLWDFIIIYQAIAAINIVLALIIFSSFMILYVISVLEWWRGVTT